MNISFLTDESLLIDTKTLALKDKNCTVEFIHHLAEIDRRKLFSDLRYSSLYDYCIKELKLSEGATHRRIVTARAMSEIPELKNKLLSGSLTMGNICIAVKFMRDNNIKDVTGKVKIFHVIENCTQNECEQKLLEILGREKARVTTITINDETFSLIQRTRNMLGGYLSNDQLLTKMAEDEIKKIESERFKQTGGKKSPPQGEGTCVIPAHIKRQKYAESPFCTICGSQTDLEYDHIKLKALGGTGEADNIRILCHNCNQRSRIKAGF
jgi:hypothetical protein